MVAWIYAYWGTCSKSLAFFSHVLLWPSARLRAGMVLSQVTSVGWLTCKNTLSPCPWCDEIHTSHCKFCWLEFCEEVIRGKWQCQPAGWEDSNENTEEQLAGGRKVWTRVVAGEGTSCNTSQNWVRPAFGNFTNQKSHFSLKWAEVNKFLWTEAVNWFCCHLWAKVSCEYNITCWLLHATANISHKRTPDKLF